VANKQSGRDGEEGVLAPTATVLDVKRHYRSRTGTPIESKHRLVCMETKQALTHEQLCIEVPNEGTIIVQFAAAPGPE
jgi:hypothetical protein